MIGQNHVTILPDGSVYACRRMESRIGNALTDDLYDLFTGPDIDKGAEPPFIYFKNNGGLL